MTDGDRRTTQRAMDDAIAAHMAHELMPGDLAVSHLVLVGIRNATGDGHNSGRVAVLMSDGSMPPWEARGLLHEGLANLDEYTEEDEDDDG